MWEPSVSRTPRRITTTTHGLTPTPESCGSVATPEGDRGVPGKPVRPRSLPCAGRDFRSMARVVSRRFWSGVGPKRAPSARGGDGQATRFAAWSALRRSRKRELPPMQHVGCEHGSHRLGCRRRGRAPARRPSMPRAAQPTCPLRPSASRRLGHEDVYSPASQGVGRNEIPSHNGLWRDGHAAAMCVQCGQFFTGCRTCRADLRASSDSWLWRVSMLC